MPTLIILIFISLFVFIFYRIKASRIKAPFKKKWTHTKANIGLGAFLICFGANRLFLQPSTVAAIICGIFILYGIFIVMFSIKSYKYYWPRMIDEAKNLRSSVNSGQ